MSEVTSITSILRNWSFLSTPESPPRSWWAPSSPCPTCARVARPWWREQPWNAAVVAVDGGAGAPDVVVVVVAVILVDTVGTVVQLRDPAAG